MKASRSRTEGLRRKVGVDARRRRDPPDRLGDYRRPALSFTMTTFG